MSGHCKTTKVNNQNATWRHPSPISSLIRTQNVSVRLKLDLFYIISYDDNLIMMTRFRNLQVSTSTLIC